MFKNIFQKRTNETLKIPYIGKDLKEHDFKIIAKEISDELINMRFICYIMGGISEVKRFDQTLKNELSKFQDKLMKG